MYFGSVRFYKHLILSVIGLLIIVPTTLSIAFGIQNYHLRHQAISTEDINVLGDNEFSFSYNNLVTKLKTHQVTAEAMEYQLKYPKIYAEKKQKAETEKDDKVAYLTFDDGPSSRTIEILDILKENNIKATFFVVYKNDEQSKEILKRIVKEGHAIGVHTASHKYDEIYQSVDSFLEDFNKVYECIYETTGVKTDIFRFPGGSINSYNVNNYQEIIAEMLRRGFTYYDWNVSSDDAVNNSTKEKIIRSTLTNTYNANKLVILMHDSLSKKNTVSSLPNIIHAYSKYGYRFDKLDCTVKPYIFSYGVADNNN